MDRNSIIGLVLIFVLLFGWMMYTQPSKEELAKQKHTQDSIAAAQLKEKEKELSKDSSAIKDSAALARNDSLTPHQKDSVLTAKEKDKYGEFYSAVKDSNRYFTIENEKIKATLCTRGGRICKVQVKGYHTYRKDSLILFDQDSSSFGLLFDTENSRTINTNELFFKPIGESFVVKGKETKTFRMRLAVAEGSFIEYEYSLAGDANMLDLKLNVTGMGSTIAKNLNILGLHWTMKTPSQEKNIGNERNASTAYFKYGEEKPDKISERSSETKSLADAKIKWVSFKQQFFTSVLIAGDYFDKTNSEISSVNEASSRYVKSFAADLSIPYDHKPSESFAMKLYFGPNHYQTLKKYEGLELERQIPLGWGIFGWINRFLVIPVFNFLDSFGMNYGVIILILTIIVKVILFPVAYKTYLGAAKMRILKPEIDEITKKYGKEDAVKKQQATMALYKKAGVNPLSGCVPVLFQIPILYALFSFFPSSIELRQQPFLWTDDLSTYDSVWNFGFSVPMYGDHMSLFALLMTISTLLYTWSNNQIMSQGSQMPGMKIMMYVMPLIFLPVLNNYSAGLSYYYFLANMITFGQTWAMRRFVDEKALHARIQENKKREIKPSKFAQRLEQMQKDRMKQMQRKK